LTPKPLRIGKTPVGVCRSPSRLAELTPLMPTWPEYGPSASLYREPDRLQARMVAPEPRASTRMTCREVSPRGRGSWAAGPQQRRTGGSHRPPSKCWKSGGLQAPPHRNPPAVKACTAALEAEEKTPACPDRWVRNHVSG